MPLPRPVPPPVIRMRLFCRRSLRNMRSFSGFERRCRQTAGSSPSFARFGMTTVYELATARLSWRYVAGHAEAVVGVLKIGRDAGTGGAAGNLDVVPPRSSAGGLALGWF